LELGNSKNVCTRSVNIQVVQCLTSKVVLFKSQRPEAVWTISFIHELAIRAL